MKKFYDREEELAQLKEMQRQAYEQYSRFVVLTGRRRVGKTSLVLKLMEESSPEEPSLYFFVGRKSEAALVKIFASEAREKLGEYVPESIRSFRELFALLIEIAKRRRFTLFIDEIQEFINVNDGVFYDIQELWDLHKHHTHMCIIVSGSIITLMEKIFKDEQEPLFARHDFMINLKPFSTGTIREILADYHPNFTPEDLLALWTITGGVARYVELLMNSNCTDAAKMIHYVCSNSDGFFISEGKSILIQEFGKQYGTYFSILDLIAHGDVTQSQIEGELAMGVSGQLKILEEKFGIIKRKRPIGAKQGSQNVRFEIHDNFFCFWFRFMHRHAALIELQNMPALEQIITDNFPTFSGKALERWFRQKMAESHKYRQIGGWWQIGGVNAKGNADDFEIDIVAETLQGEVEAYEVKRNAQRFSPSRLNEKLAAMQRRTFKGKEIAGACLSIDDM